LSVKAGLVNHIASKRIRASRRNVAHLILQRQKNMRRLNSSLIGGFLLATALVMPARGDTQPRGTAVPGTVNYVEGQASLGSQPLDSKSIGSETLETGQSITTENGKAELLLTPGVFLRVGSNSSVKMISPSLITTEIGVEEGEATIEVTEIHKQNDIRVDADGVTTHLVKTQERFKGIPPANNDAASLVHTATGAIASAA
jgi:hypothetical protein